jgi:ubiquinone/menaquinone biosynthesis C-methylase UbiE
MKLRGIEISDYAIETAMQDVKPVIGKASYTELPFARGEFDFVIAIGVVYALNLPDAIQCLKEIQRVGKGKSFITLGSYRTEEEFRLMRHWTLLGTTILHENEWVAVLNHSGYTGDYKFMNARTLNLVAQT